jgi:hypothetical protein
VSSGLVCWLSAVEVGLDKSLVVSTDVMLAVYSGEDSGENWCGEESVSNSCSKGVERFVGFVGTELVSRHISAQREPSWW